MDIPPRTATDRYLSRRGEKLDIVFDVDLGELVEGHHVVARGIMFGRPVRVSGLDPDGTRALAAGAGDPDDGGLWLGEGAADPDAWDVIVAEAQLHYEFVPGLAEPESGRDAFGWYWMLSATDDVGTRYGDGNGGAFDSGGDGDAAHGIRDLGGQIPPHARRLTIRFQPAGGWTPPEPWRREIAVDLRQRRLAD